MNDLLTHRDSPPHSHSLHSHSHSHSGSGSGSDSFPYHKIYDVIVVGGGIAGLSASQSIAKAFPDCKLLLLEASSRLGGRVRSVRGIAPWPIELGPEFVHGNKSSIKRFADESGSASRELPYPDFYYFGSSKTLISGPESEKNPDLVAMHSIFSNLSEEDFVDEDISMAQYLSRKGLNPTQMDFANSIYANDFGCSLTHLGLNECICEARRWNYGDTYFILDCSISFLISKLIDGVPAMLDWPVSLIDYSKKGNITLHGKNGGKFTTRFVIITVPITILKNEGIKFCPPLPMEKSIAINSIGMSSAIKVILAFSHKFFPRDIFDIVCEGSFLPEIWFTQYPPSRSSHTNAPHLNASHLNLTTEQPIGNFIAIGFLAGDRAVALSGVTHERIIERSLQQLDEIFGDQNANKFDTLNRHDLSKSVTTYPFRFRKNRSSLLTKDVDFIDNIGHVHSRAFPASNAFKGGYVFDWSKVPYIEGGYTYPTVGALGSREILAKPINDLMFFAGEATHPGVNPCMQAAMDTGIRASKEVLTGLMSPKL